MKERKMNSKNFFFFAAAIGILILAGEKIYRVWQVRHDEQVLQVQLVETRRRMDAFYIAELRQAYKSPKSIRSVFAVSAIKDKMLQDGYNNVEIGLIEQKALTK